MSEEEKLQLEQECLLKYSKAQMIQKYIDELEENCTLSDLWCKSQEENKQLHFIIKEVRKLVENDTDFKCITFRKADEDTWKLILASHIKENFLEVLDKENI